MKGCCNNCDYIILVLELAVWMCYWLSDLLKYFLHFSHFMKCF